MVIGKCTDVLRGICFGFLERLRGGGSGEGDIWEDLSLEEYVIGKKNSMKGAQDFLALL